MSQTRAGYVALIGRPNVGKSTLLNRLIEQKVSITSRKPQTTRHLILGIKTLADTQFVYIDTPGIHLQAKRAINRYMNKVASNTLGYVNVAIFLTEALRWTDEDDDVLKRLQSFSGPVIAAVNKIDRIKEKADLLPFLEQLRHRHQFVEIVLLSAQRNDNVDVLENLIADHLPESEFLYSKDQITTASQRFIAGELIREKLTRLLRDELPYALTVEIEQFVENTNLIRIGAVIWVERAGQKGIVIGSGGEILKKAGQQARADMEKIFDRKVFLETWVKVRSGWSDDERALHHFGYRDES